MASNFVMLYEKKRYSVHPSVLKEGQCVLKLTGGQHVLVDGNWSIGDRGARVPGSATPINGQNASQYKQYNARRLNN